LWTQVGAVASSPHERVYHAMAYDSLRGRVVLFGGGFTGGLVLGDTWEWDGTYWTQVANSGPSPRYGHALAYDSRRRRVVLFGGQTKIPGTDSSKYLDDTWEWDGAVWKEVPITGARPTARSEHAMVYDSVRGRI